MQMSTKPMNFSSRLESASTKTIFDSPGKDSLNCIKSDGIQTKSIDNFGQFLNWISHFCNLIHSLRHQIVHLCLRMRNQSKGPRRNWRSCGMQIWKSHGQRAAIIHGHSSHPAICRILRKARKLRYVTEIAEAFLFRREIVIHRKDL